MKEIFVGAESLEEERADVAFLRHVLQSMRPGETAIDAAIRKLIFGAFVFARGRQDNAAKVLRVSKRVMQYHAANHRIRPKDRRCSQ